MKIKTENAARGHLLDGLEPRRVFAAVTATGYEQFMLELINRGRADPQAEATRLGIDLNEGVSGTPISTAAKQPLALNPYLTSAARGHVQWLRENSLFQHEGSGGSTPTQRMIDAGYALTGNWGTAENLGLTLNQPAGDLTERVEANYRNLFVDAGIAGRGHRTNMMNPSLEEMGSGVATGDYVSSGQHWSSVVVGEDFAYRPGNAFLTGVVYDDSLHDDHFYTPGEGKAGFTIKATSSGGSVYTTTTATAGGYALQVPAGTYTVTASGPGISGVSTASNVVVGSVNVKRDFEAEQFASGQSTSSDVATVSDGLLSVKGTSGNDAMQVFLDGSSIVVTVGNVEVTFPLSSVKRIFIECGAGNDTLTLSEQLPGTTILGGAGNDVLKGTANNDAIDGGDGNDIISAGGGNDIVDAGAGNDTVIGEGGKDLIHGDDGEDRVNGSGGNDQVYGDTDNDRVYGGTGNDYCDGGGNVDRLYGEDGNDTLSGGSSNDRLYAGAGDDLLIGGKGTDYFDGGAGSDTARDRENIEGIFSVEHS